MGEGESEVVAEPSNAVGITSIERVKGALHSRARDPFAPLLSVEAIRGQAVVALPAVDTIASPVAGQDRVAATARP